MECEYAPVNLLEGQQRSAEYLKVNPGGLVPALQLDNGKIIFQSVAILEFLEEAFPEEPSLLPKDHFVRAIVRQAVLIIAADTQPLQNLRLVKYIGDRGQEWAKTAIENGLLVFQKSIVEKHGGMYCIGDNITLADVVLVPQLYNARRFSADLSAMGRLLEIEERLLSHPAFQASCPEKQMDCPNRTD